MGLPQNGDMLPSMYESRGGMFVAMVIACSIVSTIIVGLRFYVRRGIIKKLGADDWFLAVALVCNLPQPFLNHRPKVCFLGHNGILSYPIGGG